MRRLIPLALAFVFAAPSLSASCSPAKPAGHLVDPAGGGELDVTGGGTPSIVR